MRSREHSISALPVIPRLDRIDRLLQFLEEKHCSGRKQNSSGPAGRQSLPEDQELKTLSSAMEEVHHKGTLMERLAMLENRVLQLTMEMEEANTSGPGPGPGSSSSSIEDPAQTITKQEEVCAKPAADSHIWKTKANITRRRKWLPSWFQMGC